MQAMRNNPSMCICDLAPALLHEALLTKHHSPAVSFLASARVNAEQLEWIDLLE